MHPRLFACTLVLFLAASGCADPAKDKPKAEVHDPAPVDQASGGRELALSSDSKIEFVGSKVTGSHDGGFTDFDGAVHLVDRDPTKSRVRVSIDMNSVWSDSERLTGHLKSDDFFGVETHPTATFESTAIRAEGDGYEITGNLDLHGVEKSITFPAAITVSGDTVTAQAEFAIKRFDFAIEYKGRADDLIRDDVVIKLDLKAGPATS